MISLFYEMGRLARAARFIVNRPRRERMKTPAIICRGRESIREPRQRKVTSVQSFFFRGARIRISVTLPSSLVMIWARTPFSLIS